MSSSASSGVSKGGMGGPDPYFSIICSSRLLQNCYNINMEGGGGGKKIVLLCEAM